MNEDRSERDAGATEEPALTQKNSQTVLGEEKLAGETPEETIHAATPSSYGAAGATTDAYEEGAGEHEREQAGH